MRLVFDIETNGFLLDLNKIHCLVAQDVDTGELFSFADESPTHASSSMGAAMLMEADEVIGHNIIKFDLPALQKVYPNFKLKDGCKVTDTMVLSRLLYSDIKDRDFKLHKQGKLPGTMIGQHKLEAWGYRLGILKDEYSGPWDEWSRVMQDYCEQDVRVTSDLYRRLSTHPNLFKIERAVALETAVSAIIGRQEQRGFAFDVEAAAKLQSTLVDHKLRVEEKLQEAFPPLPYEWTPKASNKSRGYVKGQPITRYTVFNPGSRKQVGERLVAKYGWEPAEYTKDGNPKLDEETLSDLPWEEAAILNEFYMVDKRLGALATGNEAWLRHERNGRIHGSVNTIGAVTGRMTHSNPNIGQVPSCDKPYGKECRSLFIAGPGYDLLGCDADSLELRCLAHFLARYDGGEYIKAVLEGDKALGTDNHSMNARGLGLDPKRMYKIGATEMSGRDIAKRFVYALIYGAGDMKLGLILGEIHPGKASRAGKAARANLMRNIPAFGKLVEAVAKAVKERGYLVGIDGRLLHIRSDHSALNTLLQSAGAVAMKEGLVILDRALQVDKGLVAGRDYEFVANVHDEWQIEVLPQFAEVVGETAKWAIEQAGINLGFRCPLTGNWGKGRSWADTH